MRNRRKEEGSPHGSVGGQVQRLLALKEDVAVQEVVDHRVPLPVVLRPTGGIPPIRVELHVGD